MTILVDSLFDSGKKWTRWGNRMACHLGADDRSQRGLAELAEFAHNLGLRDEWLQWGGSAGGVPHFDLTPNKRALAIKAGAVEVDSKELVARCRWTREERNPGSEKI